MNFFKEVESRSDVNLNYDLLSKFIGYNFDFSKVVSIGLCVNLRTNLRESSLKLALILEDYPEKIAEAFELCQCSEELRWLLSQSSAAIGFDLFLDGRSEIEIYLAMGEEQLKDPRFQKRLSLMLSPPVLELLETCVCMQIGFSAANPEKVLYYHTRDPDNFIARLRNDLANRVHAFYRHQPVASCSVALRESEIRAGNTENINLYYPYYPKLSPKDK